MAKVAYAVLMDGQRRIQNPPRRLQGADVVRCVSRAVYRSSAMAELGVMASACNCALIRDGSKYQMIGPIYDLAVLLDSYRQFKNDIDRMGLAEAAFSVNMRAQEYTPAPLCTDKRKVFLYVSRHYPQALLPSGWADPRVCVGTLTCTNATTDL